MALGFSPLLLLLTFNPSFFILLLLGVCTIIGTFLANGFGTYYLRPIKRLINATKEVKRGNFKVQIKTKKKRRAEELSASLHTEMEELEESFNEMVRELDGIELFRNDFINNFSHEFKTPIVSIRGFAKQLQNENLTAEERREYTDIIIAESERLTKLSSNVLLLSKLEHQTILSEQSVFSLDEQLRSDILLLEKQWSKKNLDLEPDLDEVMYCGNAEVLSQLWVNLLSNAIKFTPDGGRIEVRLTQDHEQVKVTVRDSGIGMSAETLQHIFEKFYQGDSSHSSEGNGLGLALVKRIVELCGGSISIESEEGKGTTVYVSLPKKQESEADTHE